MSETLEQRTAERTAQLRLLRDVAVVANQADDVAAAAAFVLDAVATHYHWRFAHALMVSAEDADRLEPLDCCYAALPERRDAFRRLVLAGDYRRGRGLAGRVLATGRAVWSDDTSAAFGGVGAARALGIKATMAFPVLLGTRVAAVLVFFAAQPQPRSRRVTACLARIAAQLARVMERARIGEQQRQRQARLDAVYATVADALVSVDGEGCIETLNPSTSRLFGYSAAQLLGEPLGRLVPALQQPGGAVTQLASPQAGDGWELEAVRRNGERFPVYVSAMQADVEGSPTFTVVIRDHSLIVEARTRSLQAERLAAIGETVTGLAHESRNALQRSQACLSLLQLKLEGQAELLELVDDVQTAQEELQALYDELREFASPLVLERKLSSLSRLLRRTWAELAVEHEPARLTLHTAAGRSDLRCSVDQRRFAQVLRNVLENAIAMSPPGGAIDVAYRDGVLRGRAAACLLIRDHGAGLGEAQEQRVFEPFFTTRERGTGLGLSIARKIVEAHGGTIDIGNAAGGGAEISIRLPRHPA